MACLLWTFCIADRDCMSLAGAIGACLSASHDVEAICEILDEEFIGSALDVFDAVGHLLSEDEAQAQAEALFVALRSVSRKRPRLPSRAARSAGGGSSLAQFEWKREYMTSTARFEEPYTHELACRSAPLVLQQAPFCPEGFASTVWDSSIVLSRYLERRAADGHAIVTSGGTSAASAEPPSFAGVRCIELGAGCGLPGLVLHALGADVTLTDLQGNLPLLTRNAEGNARRGEAAAGEAAAGEAAAGVVEFRWGPAPLPSALAPFRPFDLVVATDVLYVSASGSEPTPLAAAC